MIETKACVVFLIILVSMLPAKTKQILPSSSHKDPYHSAIQSYIRTPLVMHEKNKRPSLYENHVLRKAVPVFILKKSPSKLKRKDMLRAESLFDRNGMIKIKYQRKKHLNDYYNQILTEKNRNARRFDDGVQLHSKDKVKLKSAFNFSDLVV